MAHKVLSCTYLTLDGMVDRHQGDVKAATDEFYKLIKKGYSEEHAGTTFVLVDRTYVAQNAAKTEKVEESDSSASQ